MKDSIDEIVVELVARHLQVAPSTIRMDHRVERDLELDPLDLVLIALRVEEIDGFEFPIALLGVVETVGDFVRLVRAVRVTELPTEVVRASDVVPAIARSRPRLRLPLRRRARRQAASG